ncbi:mechanosensitive ion channel protein 10 [Phtheirospermum japonicum]|uniref:Mechanosensitive ion channel protein n=1 Tax=Phtheirospermum japonicum TaxID=374723 RepID=A0A830D9I8_9LAMI|nr:mechanosensitive ion channel protein 10 [Phtheirospermum japonicum]
MESEISLREKAGNYDVVVEIHAPGSEEPSGKSPDAAAEISRLQMNLFTSNPAQVTIPNQTPTPILNPLAKPPLGPTTVRQRTLTKSTYSKPKSRIVEPPYPTKSQAEQNTTQTKSPLLTSPNNAPSPNSSKVNPNATPKTSAPITPRTPLMASVGGDDDDDDEDEDVYKPETLKINKKKRGKKVKVMVIIEWITFVCIMAVLISSLTVNKFKHHTHIWSLELWKWCVLVLVIFCGRLFTEWLSNTLVFLIEKNFLLKKKVLYFLFGLKKSVRIVIWLALILLAWALLINRGVRRSDETSRILNYITRGIVSTLVGAVMWTSKTLFVKTVASSFHVRTYFDRIQESIFHQYILQALSGSPVVENDSSRLSGKLSFKKGTAGGKEETKGEVINVDKLYKMRREKVSAWTMGGLIKVIRNSELPTISEVLDDSVEEDDSGEPKVITSEVEAREAANRIFRNVAKHGHKYIDEEDLLLFMPKEEVDNAFPLFEGAAESRRIKRSSFRNWVVKAYNERKCLAVSLKDAKTAIEELNKITSLLLAVFMFGNTLRSVFESIVFVFAVHPFDVGDRCVIDGVQMIVDEMNILTTIFLKPDNEKVYYPNSVLATKAISNFNRSPEMMGDAVEFAVDFNTSAESIAALKAKIKGKPGMKLDVLGTDSLSKISALTYGPDTSPKIKEIIDVNKMLMALYVTHTINFQNAGDRGDRRSDLVFALKKIFEELGIRYSLLPQEVQISYVGGAMPTHFAGGVS